MPKTGLQPIDRKMLKQAIRDFGELAEKVGGLLAIMDRKGVKEFHAMNKPAYLAAMKKVNLFVAKCAVKLNELDNK